MALHFLSWLQLALLPDMGPGIGDVGTTFPPDQDGDGERDGRSDSEWFDAVIGYLEFRAGSRWRRGRSKYRNAARYLEYLDALRLLSAVRYHPPARIEPVLSPLSYEKKPPARASVPWVRRPWDHFRACACASCRSLRARGIEPASTRPSASEEIA